jgi:restriction system protein
MLIKPLIIGVFIGLLCFGLCYWWIGIVKRRQAEVQTGIANLASMRWRECVGLLIQSLEKEGYREEISSRQPGDGGTEFLLKKGSALTLLSYKHGTAYHLGEANIRDFANGVQLIGAAKGILVTLGTIDNIGHDLAHRYGIELIDGAGLWPRVEQFMPKQTLEAVQREASGQTKSKVQLGGAISVAAAALSFVLVWAISPNSPEPEQEVTVSQDELPEIQASAAPPAEVPAPIVNKPKAATPVAKPVDSAQAKIDATAKAFAEIDSLTDEQLATRKADTAKKVLGLPQVRSAAWYSGTTLQLYLNTENNDDKKLIDEICRIVVAYEELRYTRLQLEPPSGSSVPVRFRQCQ